MPDDATPDRFADDASLRELNERLSAAVEAIVGESGAARATGADGASGSLRDDALGLRAVYRSHGDRTRDLADALGSRARALAYAASRMSSTHAAALAVLDRFDAGSDAPPRTVLDLGGGTGAAAIAAAQLWPDVRVTVVDRSVPALELGKEIAARLGASIAARIEWRRGDLVAPADAGTDLAILCYSLVEADDPDAVLAAAGAAATSVAVIEPGSREGFGNVLTARRLLPGADRGIVAPCPQDGACPLAAGAAVRASGGTGEPEATGEQVATGDWCHFGVRTARTARQVRLKDGTRGFEDEKYSYVVVGPVLPGRPEARVIARPRPGKRLVRLTLCTASGRASEVLVPRSSPHYPVARRAEWGDGVPSIEG